ncbi:MAG: hypothetical protein HY784_08070 [Chloroflexi bacterium]|nr:hypothetical protein [Chloroflexota bacterium]
MVNFKQFSAAARINYREDDIFEVRYASSLTHEVYTARVAGEDVIADLRGAFQDDGAEPLPPVRSTGLSPSGWKTRLTDQRFKAMALRRAWEEIMPELEAEEEEEEEDDFYDDDDDWE